MERINVRGLQSILFHAGCAWKYKTITMEMTGEAANDPRKGGEGQGKRAEQTNHKTPRNMKKIDGENKIREFRGR